MEFTIQTVEELPEVVGKILLKYPDQKYFAFYGEMGAGKTTTIKALCDALEVIDHVSSPTFSIVNEYVTKQNKQVFHFDFYRIKNQLEVLDLGWENYVDSNAMMLMEWTELVENLLPDQYIKITILVQGKERRLTTELIGG